MLKLYRQQLRTREKQAAALTEKRAGLLENETAASQALAATQAELDTAEKRRCGRCLAAAFTEHTHAMTHDTWLET